MFACANWFIIVCIQNIALVNWESFLFSSILTREKLRGICQYTHCDSQMIISQHCKCGWATACFGDSSRRISLETWLKAISYAFASPTISFPHLCFIGFPGSTSGKEPACQCRRHKRHRFNPWVGKIPWRRAWQPTPVFWPGESHGQRSQVGYIIHGVTKSWIWLKGLSMHGEYWF